MIVIFKTIMNLAIPLGDRASNYTVI